MAVNIARLNPKLRTIARNIPRAARTMGFNARVTSGYRSPVLQARLYNEYIQGRSHYPVAPPGSSLHEKGLAIDVVSDDTQKLVSLLTSVGLSWYGPGDPVHFSIKGAPGASQRDSDPYRSWAEGPGASIPSWAASLPIVGTAFGIARDPEKAAEKGASRLLDVILGFL